MKYIVIELKTKGGLVSEHPFVFPASIVHRDMAIAMITVMKQTISREGEYKILAGGFINSWELDGCQCYGESTSLNVKSRGQVDDMLLFGHDMDAGTRNKPQEK